MADTRLYIYSKELGLAARLYSRSGCYHEPHPHGISELLAVAENECAISDDFQIIGEGTPMERVEGTSLWKVTGEPQPEIDWLAIEKQANTDLRKQLEQKQNTIAMLARKLRSLGYEP